MTHGHPRVHILLATVAFPLVLSAGAASAVVIDPPAAPAAPATAPKPDAPKPDATPSAPEKKTLLATLEADPQYSTFVKALKDTGVADAIKEKGPYTVFAPTNAAFEKLGKERLEALNKPEGKDELARIVKFHVVSGRLESEQIVRKAHTPKTLEGQALQVRIDDKSKLITVGAEYRTPHGEERSFGAITRADVAVSDGIIQGIDAVVTPPPPPPPAAQKPEGKKGNKKA